MSLKVTFNALTHTYQRDGLVVPGVTCVLAAAGLVNFSAVPEVVMQAAQRRGTAVHLATWYDEEGDLLEGSLLPEYRGYLKAWRAFRADLGVGPSLEIESMVYSKTWDYAGKLDRIVPLEGGGKRAILDLKTGPIQPATALQLAAYAMAEEPPGLSCRRLAVQLRKNGSYSVKEFSRRDLHRDFMVFRAALALYRWKELHHIKQNGGKV